MVGEGGAGLVCGRQYLPVRSVEPAPAIEPGGPDQRVWPSFYSPVEDQLIQVGAQVAGNALK